MGNKDATRKFDELHARARALGERYGITGYEEAVMGLPPISEIEHTIHELAHARLLNILAPYQRQLSTAISVMITDEDEDGYEAYAPESMERNRAVTHERRTFSIEWLVIQKLGLPITWADVLAASEVQGVEDFGLMRHECDTGWAQEHAQAIVELLTATP